jgi:hypothetical protein
LQHPSHLPEGPPRTSRTVDVAIAALMAGVVFVLCLPYLDASFPNLRRDQSVMADEGTIISDADRMARGHVPYREVWAYRGLYGFLPYMLAFKIAEPSARNARLVQFAIVAVWTAVAYALGLAVTRRRFMAGVLASWPFLVAWTAWSFAYFDLSAQLYCALAALAVVAVEARPERRPGWLLAAAGGLVGAAIWTSFAQGVPVLVALAAALALKDCAEAAPLRAALRRQAAYFGGFAAATLAMILWLLPQHAVADAFDAIIIFPLRYYHSSAANTTKYGYDIPIYVQHWRDSGVWLSWVARIFLWGLALVPALAVTIGLVWIGASLFWRRSGWRPAAMPRGALVAAALAAAAVPVLLNRTRSDVCHIGFIVVGCTVVVGALVSRAWRAPSLARRAAARVGLSLLVATPLASLVIYGQCLALRPRKGIPADQQGREAAYADLYAARLRPGERFVATPYGGWPYVYSHHDNATSFALLFEDPYCRGQWATAARQIVDSKPRFLAMPASMFAILADKEPSLKSLYFGSDRNYLLDRAEPGPALASTRWWLTRLDLAGQPVDTRGVDLVVEGQLPRVRASFGGGPVRAVLYGDLFQMFEADTTYVGTLAPDGASMQGRVFKGPTESGSFRAVASVAPRGPAAPPSGAR